MASVVVLPGWVRPKVCVYFHAIFESPGFLEKKSTGVIVTFSMEWSYLMKWSYKKFLYLRLELFRISNEWLRKRHFRLCDVSPTYWAPQPLPSHVITYIKFELFQSRSLSIWMPYLLPLIEDVIVDLHEIWWHVKHLLALHLDILENLLLIRLVRRKDFAVRPELDTDWDFGIWRTKVKGRKCNLQYSRP